MHTYRTDNPYRLMRQDLEGKLKLASDTDAGFELTLCA